MAGFVVEAKQRFAEQVRLPEEYTIEWGGQRSENMERANRRLKIIVPTVVIGGIVSNALLALVILPTLYISSRGRQSLLR